MSKKNLIVENLSTTPTRLPGTRPTGSFVTGSSQPILEGLVPLKKDMITPLRSGLELQSPADKAFVALHRVERWADPAGNGDEVFCGSNVKQASRSPNYGYKTGEDAKHYDDLSESENHEDGYGVFDPALVEFNGVSAAEAHLSLLKNGFMHVEDTESAALYALTDDPECRIQIEFDSRTKRIHTALILSEDVDAGDLAEAIKEIAVGYGLSKDMVLATIIATAEQEGATIEEVVGAVSSGMISEMLEDEDEDVVEDIGSGSTTPKSQSHPVGGVGNTGALKSKKLKGAKSVKQGITGEEVEDIPEAKGLRGLVRKIMRDQVTTNPKVNR
jgi:hypothetical protein